MNQIFFRLKSPLKSTQRYAVSQSIKGLAPDDPTLLDKKRKKTKEHFLPDKGLNLPGGVVSYPDDVEFYKKVVVAGKSQGFRAVRMSKEIAALQHFYLTDREFSAEEIVQQCTELGIGLRHLARAMDVDEKLSPEEFKKLFTDPEKKQTAMEYLFPSGLYDHNSRPRINDPLRYVNRRVINQIIKTLENESKKPGDLDQPSTLQKAQVSNDVYNAVQDTNYHIKYYGVQDSLESVNFVLEIRSKIAEADAELERLHSIKFQTTAAYNTLQEMLEDSVRLRFIVKRRGFLEKDKMLHKIGCASKKSKQNADYDQIVDELQRLADHQLCSYHENFIAALVKQNEEIGEDQCYYIKEPKLEKVEKIQLFNGTVCKDVNVIETTGMGGRVGTGPHAMTHGRGQYGYTFADIKLVPVTESIKDGNNATITINGQSFTRFFPHIMDRLEVLTGFNLLSKLGEYHVEAIVYGDPLEAGAPRNDSYIGSPEKNDGEIYGKISSEQHIAKGFDSGDHRTEASGAVKNAICQALYRELENIINLNTYVFHLGFK